jgi:hypothetical protein
VSFTKLDYCQYLLSSQTNYTLTNLADHLQVFSHDTINRYLKRNRLVDDNGGVERYKQIEQLCWSREEQQQGKLIKIKNFPSHKKVKLFRVTVSTDRTDYIVTNDLSQNSTDEVQEANAVRWKIEEFHRGVKQLTGLEACQCRKARIQRNHIACAILA